MYQDIGGPAYKKDLHNITSISNHLNNPQNNFKSLHIAGTNGKGSCCHMLSSIFQESGYKVGLYTSPHLLDFRERIRVNGDMISKKDVKKFIETNFNFFDSNNFSFFEMTVGLAFNYFSDQNVDLAIIEVGMGGRLDSTNIIKPELSIITNVSLDHINFLGDNISEISKEKAGIIKNNTPVVIGETNNENENIFKKYASLNKSEISFADKFDYEDYNCDLRGNYQKKNIKTVLRSLEVLNNLGFEISQNSIKNGLKNVVVNTGIRGRWEIIQNEPMIICDTGHNVSAIKEIVSQLENIKFSTLHIIIGFSNDKDIDIISKIFPLKAKYYFIKPNVQRGQDPIYVRNVFYSNNRIGKKYNSITQALNAAKDNALNDDLIFIGGSSFIFSEIF